MLSFDDVDGGLILRQGFFRFLIKGPGHIGYIICKSIASNSKLFSKVALLLLQY